MWRRFWRRKRPEFKGLWVNDPEQLLEFDARGLNPWPNALLFIPGRNMIRVDLVPGAGDRPDITYSTKLCWVEGDTLKLVDIHDESETIVDVPWRRTADGKLEVRTDGTWYRYVPTDRDQLERLGFPRGFFEVWEEEGREQGWDYTEVAAFPDDA